MIGTLQRLSWLWRAVAGPLGSPLKATALCIALPNVRTMGRIGLLLDHVFSARFRAAKVERPVVIVGNPRSGTTFLQRFLVQHGIGCGRQVWQMVYPSLTQQFFMRPLLPLLEKVSPTRYHTSAAHKTGLSFVETDDASWLFRFTDGFFLYAFFLAHLPQDLIERFDPANRNMDRDNAWLRALWRRSVVAHGADRVVAKVFGLGACMPRFQAAFPDARVLYMARDPLNTIPSGMSLVTGVLDRAFGFWSRPKEVRDRYLARLYSGLVLLLRRFTADWNEGRVDRDRVYVVRFDRLMSEFDTMMPELLDFVGHDQTEALSQAITERAEKQRQFKSPHAYSLEQFGLTEARIRTDCAFFYETFLEG